MTTRLCMYDSATQHVHWHGFTVYHFTGKERDAESGLDYFGARYYGSSMGRWMSPDWAAKPEAVPHSDLTNPQSLNLYGYVNNNPLSKADKDGHDPNDVYRLLGGAELVAPEATPFILGAAAAVAIYQNRDAISQGAQSLATSVTSLFSKSDRSSGDKPSTLAPGPHTGEGVPARSGDRNFTPGERGAVNGEGAENGCHTCGTKDPGTKSGNFVPDHQPPTALNPEGSSQRLYPQCLSCSRTQGGEVNAAKQQVPQPPPPPKPPQSQ